MKISESARIFKLENRPRVLAIIPARGGSKGLPRKNIMDLCGKPLITYSIEVARQSASVHRVIVSTDDETIADISRSYGAEVPFLRPKELAEDHSSIGDAARYTVERLRQKGYVPDVVIILYPTHPFRTPALIDSLAGKVLEGHSPVSTVKLVHRSPYSYFQKNGEHRIAVVPDAHMRGIRSSQKPYFRNYGLFTGFRIGCAAERPYLHVITDPISLIDIDTLQDLYHAEEILAHGLFDFQGKTILSDHASNYTHFH